MINQQASKYKLDTPCLVIDRKNLIDNLSKMQTHCNNSGVNLRPHAKTHKCSKIAKMQIDRGAIGISVAKVSEAEILAENDIPGILITSPVVTAHKINKLIKCIKLRPDLAVVIDNLNNALELNKAADSNSVNISVLIDIDSGIGRTGIQFEDVLNFAEKIKNYARLNLIGIQCYAGNLQHITSYSERLAASLNIMHKAGIVAKELRANNFCCEIVTGTGTGTYDIDIQEKAVTEIQPGSYTVMDVEYNSIGSKETPEQFDTFSNAMTLLTSVISSNNNNHVTVDAGWKSLYVNDLKPKIINPSGLLYDWGGFGDEHGKVTVAHKSSMLPQLGDVLEMIVPHCDPTINLFDKFYIIEQGIIIDEWHIDLRGKSQ